MKYRKNINAVWFASFAFLIGEKGLPHLTCEVR